MGGGGPVDLANAVYAGGALEPGDRRVDRARAGCGRAPVPLDGAAAARRPRAHRRWRHLRRLPAGRLPAPRPGDLHPALPLPPRRQRPARRAPADHRRAERDRLRRRVRAVLTAGGEHQEGRARAARRADRTPRTRASATCRSRFSAAGTTLTVAAPNNPNEAPAGHYMLFAVDAAGVPSVSAIVAARSHGRLQLRRPSTSRSTARPPQHALRDDGGPREGRQRLRVGRPVRQVLHEGGRPLAGGRPRFEPHGQHLRRPALRSRRRAGRAQHARLPLRDAHGRRDLEHGRRP